MPLGDGTGPQGLGPSKGRGAGYCSGFGIPGSVNYMPGGAGPGFGRCGRSCRHWFGGGRGWRNWYQTTGRPRWGRAACGYPYALPVNAEEEMALIRDEADFLKKQVEEIQSRIGAMGKTETSKD